MKPKEPPEGCQEIPGFILPLPCGKRWYTKDGRITIHWRERGVWPTAEAARKAMCRFFSEGD